MVLYDRNIHISVNEVRRNLLKADATMDNSIYRLEKSETFKISVILDMPTFEIKDIECLTFDGYFSVCKQAVDRLQAVKGMTIGAGYNKKISEIVGGKEGCIHLVELLIEIGRCVNLAYYNSYIVKDENDEKAIEGFEKNGGNIGCIGLNSSIQIKNNKNT